MIAGVITSKSTRNGLWILFERFVSMGISTVIMVLSARYLGAANFGILNYGLTLVTLFAGVMKLGLDSIMVNELIGHRKREGEYLGTSIVLRVVSSFLSMVVIVIFLLFFNANQPLLIVVSIVQSVILIFQAGYILDYWFQSKLKSKYVSIAKITATLVTGGYSTYLLLSDKSIVWFAVSTVLTGFVVAILLYVFYKQQGGPRMQFSVSSAKYLLSKSHHFIVANIISLIYVQIDKVMIGNMINEQQLGIYSVAVMFCTAWMFIPDAITTSLRPGIVHSKAKDEDAYLYKLKRLYFILFWTSMTIAGLVTLTVPYIIPLVFGEEYKSAIAVTQIAVWFAPLSALGIARNIWLVTENKHRYAKYILVFGVIVNVGLNIILIPALGVLGAAYSTLATEFITCLVAPLFFRQTRIHTKIVLDGILTSPGDYKK